MQSVVGVQIEKRAHEIVACSPISNPHSARSLIEDPSVFITVHDTICLVLQAGKAGGFAYWLPLVIYGIFCMNGGSMYCLGRQMASVYSLTRYAMCLPNNFLGGA